MSKELKELKALKAIGKLQENGCYINTTVEYKIVETALKENEKRIEELEETNHLMYLRHHKDQKKIEALDIIKSFANYQIVEVQGQWYLIQGVSFDKSPKIPITEAQAILLAEVLQ